ncbi:hypothetical protein AVEN_80821-2-1, partial [Araneus ventricosus]
LFKRERQQCEIGLLLNGARQTVSDAICRFKELGNDTILVRKIMLWLVIFEMSSTYTSEIDFPYPVIRSKLLSSATLFLSSAWVENVPYVSLQRFVTKKDSSRRFLPSLCLLTEREWDRLQRIRKKITESCKSLMFRNFLKKKILLEVSSRSPRTNLQMELSDVEMVLSTSLTEIFADNIKSRIDDVLVCNGCLQNQANQLGHECVTMNFESRHSLYGDLAILSVDIELLVKDFVEKNMQMLNYINETF